MDGDDFNSVLPLMVSRTGLFGTCLMARTPVPSAGTVGDGEGRLGLKESPRRSHTHSCTGTQRHRHSSPAGQRAPSRGRTPKKLEVAESKTLTDLFDEWVKTVDRKDGGKNCAGLSPATYSHCWRSPGLRSVRRAHRKDAAQRCWTWFRTALLSRCSLDLNFGDM